MLQPVHCSDDKPVPSTEVTLYRFAAQPDVLPEMLAQLETLCQPCEQHLRFRAMTAMEELFTNFILHSGERSKKKSSQHAVADAGTLGFSVRASVDALSIHYQDDGPAFNPFDGLEAASSHIHLPVADRPIGGLGRLLVSRLADTACYSRQHPLNCIDLEFVRRAAF